MRHFPSFAAAAALALAASASAQTGTDEPRFTPETFRAHVGFLADDLLEGRNAGERGYDLAALYVAQRFAALGLKPAVGDTWYQQVPFIEHRLGGEPASLAIGGRSFANGAEVLLSSSAVEPDQAIEAPLVFAGFGLDAPALGYSDYAGLDVRGKIVVTLSGVPKGTPSEIGAHLNSEKRRMAEARGAIGLLTIRTRAEETRRPWASMARSANEPGLSWVAPDGKPFIYGAGVRFRGTLDTVAAEAAFAGARRSLDRVLAEADRPNARPRGFALKPTVRFSQHSVTRTFSSPNVLAMLPGSDPALAGEYVVLMAHLDHEGVDKVANGDQIYNGAMDNATGVATLIEVARAMKESGVRPRRPILFAAVTAEEDGLLGAQYLAKNPVVGSGKVVGVVNLDMPVLLYDFTDVVAFGSDHSTLGPIVARAGAKMGVSLSPDPLPQEGLFTRSDHYRFVQEGIPAVFLMTGFAGDGKEKFTDFLATHYHKPSDDMSLPIDWQAAAKFARINYLIAREIADSDEAPRWYEDSVFGKLLAPDQPKAARSAAR
jgi:Zn-dependent M28 family amino/carboxypeptidase